MMPVPTPPSRLLATALFGSPRQPPLERLARIVIAAILIGMGSATILFAAAELPMGDLRVYLAAAERLAAGIPLYETTAEPFNAYWYSPWLAAAFVPVTALPYPIVVAAWLVMLLVASALVIFRLWSYGAAGILAAGLFGPLLLAVACGGNVQPLLVAALLYRAERRDAPVWIGVAASLKVTPILFVLVLIAERRWRAVVVTTLVATLLWLPALPLGFTTAGVADWGRVAPSLLGISALAYGGVVVGACAVALFVPARGRWLAAAAAAVVALPRLFAYDVTLVAAGVSRSGAPPDSPGGKVWQNPLRPPHRRG